MIQTKRKLTDLLAIVLLFWACGSESPSVPRIGSTNTRDPKAMLSPEERFGDLFARASTDSSLLDNEIVFVDLLPKMSTDSILMFYDLEKNSPNFQLPAFIREHFDVPASRLDATTSAPTLKDFLQKDLNARIYRADTVNLGSLLPLPKPFVSTGRAIGDAHYAESYFLMLGLEATGRLDLLENMVENFAYLIDTEGFIPHRNRTYCLSRSAPPFFACMVQLLAKAKKSDAVFQKYLPQLEKEYAFWMQGAATEASKELFANRRIIQIDRNTLNRYFDEKDTPRPESFAFDEHRAHMADCGDLRVFMHHLRAASESGWDFSSRWLTDGTNIGTVHTSDFIPIDLNALLYNLETVIMKGKIVANRLSEAAKFEKLASKRREALMRYCWNEGKGMFFDFDAVQYKQSSWLTAAMVYPLCFKMVTKREADKVASAVESILLNQGGIVTTLNNSGQPWDAPYGNAALQWMAIQGLRNYGHDSLANTIAERWISAVIEQFRKTGKTFGHYNVTDVSQRPPSVSESAGATTGVLLKLLYQH